MCTDAAGTNHKAYVWVIVAVVTIILVLAVTVAAYVIYRQRTKVSQYVFSPNFSLVV